ncbi:MAG TPA: sigma 54-interacting transcriptional regulator [Terriglobales bacterium]|nr:sigma 54-interacting transcriptional regulator [Terriglobales bacterium]
MNFEALQELALRMAGERSVDRVLQHIVEGLRERPGVALARVWIAGTGDECASCRMRSVCPDQSACLHLAASAGTSVTGESWTRTNGSFRRIPIGRLKVGSIAANREGLLLTDPLSEHFTNQSWVRDEGISSFAGHPLIYHDETLGVLAVFRRQQVDMEEFQWLRMFADHAAAAVANARAFSALAQAERRIRQDERELRLLIDSLPLSVGAIDTNDRLYYINSAGQRYLGRTLADLTVGTAEDHRALVYAPEDLEAVRSIVGSARGTGTACEFEARLRRHDGEYRWQLIRYEPLLDEQGRVVRWYVIGVDIDERKRAEERVRTENVVLREAIDQTTTFEEIVGASPRLRDILANVVKVAPTDSTVLILGETGTGKELVARAIHKRSRRSSQPFISVNCAAIPPALIASELFGHEKGAFTGAVQRRAGRFELAEGGTIFLDEIGELPLETQVSLLRVIQEREFERLGGNRPLRVNVRIIAATHRDLLKATNTGAFRSDLFYRLNVFPISIPPLRERAEDIPMLVQSFVSRFARNVGKRFASISAKTLELLQTYEWPGNIRELQNVLERAVIVAETDILSVDETWLRREPKLEDARMLGLPDQLTEQERGLIEAALMETRGRVAGPSGAAAKLRMAPTTLDSRIKALGIDKNAFKTNY